MDQEMVMKAALAGLLHDIGKFAQRAGELGSRTWDGEAEQDYKYKHALYSGDFVEKFVPEQWAKGLSGPARHHRPQSHHDRVIALADRLSAGERADEREDHPKQLQSIFCSLTGLTGADGEAVKTPEIKYLPLKKLAIRRDTIFPVDTVDDSHGTYKGLWDEFAAEAETLKAAHKGDQADLPTYLHCLLNLMQQYTWCIPSAYYQSVPDVSLYDHSRMTAALAACLAEQPEDKVQTWLANESQDEPVALLVGGDISGVQKFIYTISSSGAAKALRGRSFYLQTLTEAVAYYTLKQLDLPVTNLVYAGGGNFFLLAGEGQGKTIQGIAADVSKKLVTMHQGELSLILSFVPISAKQFDRKHFHNAWDFLHQELNRAKLQPMASLGQARFVEQVGSPLGEGGDNDNVCAISGQEIPEGKGREIESGGSTIRISDFTNSIIEVGNELAKATHLITTYRTPEVIHEMRSWQDGLRTFGFVVLPVNANRDDFDEMLVLPKNLQHLELTTVNPNARYERTLDDLLNKAQVPVIQGLRPFAQLVPSDSDGNPLTFDELADASKGGLKRWAVLRMDVDNLGKLFEKGFSRVVNGQTENSLTLSRMAQLSFSLRLFFESWLPELGKLDKEGRYKGRLYLQYAGGDDLFIVGSWDALPEFATAIQQSFAEFVCHHPSVTLSGGISMASKKYPLYQAAYDAERAENAAKSFHRANPQSNRGPTSKNAISFLGQAVDWEDFETVRIRAHQLEKWCGDDDLSKAILQTLLSIHAEYKQGREQALKQGRWKPDQLYYGPWMWHLAYRLGQRIHHKDTSEEVKQELEQLEKDMLAGPAQIETIGLTARWAQYLVRKERSK